MTKTAEQENGECLSGRVSRSDELQTSAARHTPGPWIAAAGPSSVVGWPVVSQQGRSICSITWRERAVPAGEAEETKEETRANARLIAAAPDLLATLKAMREAYSDTPISTWLHAINAAIAKAEGTP